MELSRAACVPALNYGTLQSFILGRVHSNSIDVRRTTLAAQQQPQTKNNSCQVTPGNVWL
jgi:hypothetical protein